MGQSQGQKEKVARHHDILAWSTEESESSKFEPGPHLEEEEKMGVSPVVVWSEWKRRFEGLREGESTREGDSCPFLFHPVPSPKEN